MHRMVVPLRHTSVLMARAGAGPCSSYFLFNVLVGSVSLTFRNACISNLFLIVLVFRPLLAYCLFGHFAATALIGSDVGYHFLQDVMLVAASLKDRLYILTTFKTTRRLH